MQKQKEIEKILDLLGIKDFDNMPKLSKINALFDVYNLIPRDIQRQLYDFKQFEYYVLDFEDYILENYEEEYRLGKITQADLHNMARLLFYDFDANLSFNTLVENVAEEYLKYK